MSDPQAPADSHQGNGEPPARPLRYGDEHEWQTLHPDLAEAMLRRLYIEAPPLFAYLHREAMMEGIPERKPYRWEKQGAPDRQGGAR